MRNMTGDRDNPQDGKNIEVQNEGNPTDQDNPDKLLGAGPARR